MKSNMIWILVIICFVSCQSNSSQNQAKLEAAETRITELETMIDVVRPTSGKILTHHVYFNLKEGLTRAEINDFKEGLSSLSKIVFAKNLKVGKGADTGDKRLVTDYDYVLSMYFENLDDLRAYATDEFHLKVRSEIGPMLEKAPVVYDSWVE